MIKICKLIANRLCYLAGGSELQPLCEHWEGRWRHHLWRPHPSMGAFQVFRLPAGSSRGGAQPDSLGSAQLPGAGAPALSQGLSCSGNTARNCNPFQSQHPETLPLAAPFTIRTPPAQAQHRRSHCYRIQDCARQCFINLMLKLHFHFQKLCLEQYDKHRQGNYLWNLCELCLC